MTTTVLFFFCYFFQYHLQREEELKNNEKKYKLDLDLVGGFNFEKCGETKFIVFFSCCCCCWCWRSSLFLYSSWIKPSYTGIDLYNSPKKVYSITFVKERKKKKIFTCSLPIIFFVFFNFLFFFLFVFIFHLYFYKIFFGSVQCLLSKALYAMQVNDGKRVAVVEVVVIVLVVVIEEWWRERVESLCWL